MRVDEIARQLNAALEGAGDLDIAGAATLESAGPLEIAFVGNRKAAAQADQSRAGCLLVTDEFPAGRTAHPRRRSPRQLRDGDRPALSAAGWSFRVFIRRAVIAPDAEIASTAAIGPLPPSAPALALASAPPSARAARIGANVRLRRGLSAARLTSPSTTTSASAIARCCTRAACSAPTASDSCAAPNGYQKFPQIGRVEIGDDVEIGANSCVDRAALGVTRIGDGVKLDNMVHIGHNCSIGQACCDRGANRDSRAEWWWKITP